MDEKDTLAKLKGAFVNARQQAEDEASARLGPFIMPDGVVIDWIGGNCPVQAEGTVDGKPFYFRARGNEWALGVGGDPVGLPNWEYAEQYGDRPYAAGWMSELEALHFIARAVEIYRSNRRDQ